MNQTTNRRKFLGNALTGAVAVSGSAVLPAASWAGSARSNNELPQKKKKTTV